MYDFDEDRDRRTALDVYDHDYVTPNSGRNEMEHINNQDTIVII